VILYRKAPPLRIVRASVPEPPYWAATTIAPYSARRAAPVAVDYVGLTATAARKLEVEVCDDVRDELERGGLCHPEHERGAWADGRRATHATRPLAHARGDRAGHV